MKSGLTGNIRYRKAKIGSVLILQVEYRNRFGDLSWNDATVDDLKPEIRVYK